jgi:hypothetical protein
MVARREHGSGRRGDTKPREEGGEGGREREDRGSPQAASSEPGWGRGGHARWGGERSCAWSLGEGEGESDFGWGAAGGWAPPGRVAAMAPTARAGGGRLGHGAGCGWAAESAQGGAGGGAGWAARKPAQKRRWGSFLFSFCSKDSGFIKKCFTKTKQNTQRKRCVARHDATTKETHS